MNTFSIDLGFDWNIQKEDRELHLQECFYMQLPTIGTPSYFRVAAVGDRIGFSIYDITANLPTSSSQPPEPTRTIKEGKLVFRSADGNGPSSPFGPGVGDLNNPISLTSGSPLDVSGSLTFNGNYPHWQGAKQYEVREAGRFIYLAELVVQDEKEVKLFVVDPEMETGPG